jgi:hypothetical protein
MSRNLTAAAITEITAQNMRPVIFAQLYFVSGWIYLWSGFGSIVWNGQTWVGVGTLGTIGSLAETSDVTAAGLQLSLSGIPADLISKALGEVRQGAPVILYQAFLTAAGAVVSNPYNAWSGRMDTCQIAEGSDTATITITCESRLIDLNRSRERRYQKQDQTIDFPGDLGFDFVPSLQQLNVVWGSNGSTVPIAPPVGTGGSDGTGHPGGSRYGY